MAHASTDPVVFLYRNGIAKGVEDGSYQGELSLSVEQLCVMLCRHFLRDGSFAVTKAYENGWLDYEALTSPRSPMTFESFYRVVFSAFRIPVYDSKLYEGGADATLCNELRVAKELELPLPQANAKFITRNEAAIVLFLLLTGSTTRDCLPNYDYQFRRQNAQ